MGGSALGALERVSQGELHSTVVYRGGENLSLRGVTYGGIRRGKIRMVEGIKRVRPELERLTLCDVERLGERGVELLLSIRVQRIRPRIAIGHRRRVNDESAGIEPLGDGRVAYLTIPNPVRPIGLSIVKRSRVVVGHIEARSTPDMQKRRVFPTPEDCVHQAICIAQEPLPPPKRQHGARLHIENVGDVLRRWSIVLVDVRLIEVVDVAIVAVGEVAAVRITCINGRRLTDGGGKPHRQRVVPTGSCRFGNRNIAQLRVLRKKRALRIVVRTLRGRRRLVNVPGVVIV